MTIESELDYIERTYPLPASHERCARFFLAAMRHLRPAMPKVALDAFSMAEAYWVGGDRSLPLGTAKADVWRELDRMKDGVDAPKEPVLRCVLFVLDPAPTTRDIRELLEWFFDFLEQAGSAAPVDLGQLLSASFP